MRWRKRLAAALFLAGALAAVPCCWLLRSYLELRAFADQIYAPLAGVSIRAFDGWSGERAAGGGMLVPVAMAGGPADGGMAGIPPDGPADAAYPASPARPSPSSVELERTADLDGGPPFALLFIGVDRRAGDRGRSDAMLVVVLNPGKRASLVVSIPRDTRTSLAGLPRPVTDKINHAYAFGGTESTVATVERFLGIPVSRYIQADMEGFRAMVDLVGGVRVDNARAFHYEGHFFPEGTLELDGEAALAYVRMRKDDPRGDHGRTDRQKTVLEALARSVTRPDRIGQWPELLAELSNHMKTDLSFRDWKALAKHYRKAADAVEIERVAGSGIMLDGIYYYSVTDEERERLSRKLAEYLTVEPGRQSDGGEG